MVRFSVLWQKSVVSCTGLRACVPSLELPSENGPLMALLKPPRPLVALLASFCASLSFFLAANASCFSLSLFRIFSRSNASFSSAARSSLLRRPVKVGLTGPFLPPLVLPRLTEGDADLDDGSALFSPSKRCAGGRVEVSAPSCGVAVADDVWFGVDSFSAGVGGFASASPSSLGTTVGTDSLPVGGSNVGGVAPSVASLALSVARPAPAPPLAPVRARVLPLPRGFGGIGNCKCSCRSCTSDSATLRKTIFLSIANDRRDVT